jgi:single-strand DNA-binding protein
MNVVTVAGPIGKDAELKFVGENQVASFSVADSAGRDKPTIWWNCQLWGKRAATLAQYLLKGQLVTVSGSVEEREWTSKDGQKVKSMQMRVNDVSLMGKRDGAPASKPTPASAPSKPAPAPSGFDDMGDDCPF